MKLAQRTIGRDRPVLVIAEIGVNHDGSPGRALELIDVAAACGADAVKLQIFRAETLMHPSSAFAAYQQEQCAEATPIDMLRRYELSPVDLRRIVSHARARGLLAIATPFSPGDLPIAEQLNLDAIKIASPDLVNLPLLSAARASGKPLLVSTGAATLAEVDSAVDFLRDFPFALLHCISSYPTPDDQAHLFWIPDLLARFHVPIGYSDHTTEVHAGALAVAAGASIVEKHLTYDTRAPGPDHAASADPQTFAEYIRLIRLAERFRGSSSKRVLPIEQDVRRVSRQSLVLTRDLAAGSALTGEDLTTQRPGTGISAAYFNQLIGRRLARDLSTGTMLQWDMLAEPVVSGLVSVASDSH